MLQFSSLCRSVVSDSATTWSTTRQASLSITNSQSSPKPMSIKSVMLSNHLILCCHLLSLLSVLTSIRVFSNESPLHIRWAKYWTFSFNIRPSNEHPGLISFWMDWLDLLAVQGKCFRGIEIKNAQKSSEKWKSRTRWLHSELYHKLRGEQKHILLKCFQKITEEHKWPNSFCKASISLIPKPDNNVTGKENHRQNHWWT